MKFYAAQLVPFNQPVAVWRGPARRAELIEIDRGAFEAHARSLDEWPLRVRLGHGGHDVGRVVYFTPTHRATWLEPILAIDRDAKLAIQLCERGCDVSLGFLSDPDDREPLARGHRHMFAAATEVALLPPGTKPAIPGARVLHETGDPNWQRFVPYLSRDDKATLLALAGEGFPADRLGKLAADALLEYEKRGARNLELIAAIPRSPAVWSEAEGKYVRRDA